MEINILMTGQERLALDLEGAPDVQELLPMQSLTDTERTESGIALNPAACLVAGC